MDKEIRNLTDRMASLYHMARKKEKGRFLDTYVSKTGYNRKYASYLLNHWEDKHSGIFDRLLAKGNGAKRGSNHRGARIYDREVYLALRKIWHTFGHPCSKYLSHALRATLPALCRYGHFHFNARLQQKLQRISAATIDRLLAKEKKKHQRNGTSRNGYGKRLFEAILLSQTQIESNGSAGVDGNGESRSRENVQWMESQEAGPK